MKITVIGSSNTDMIVKVPRIPRPGETILGGVFQTAAGGKGANQAVAAARAGGAVTFIARVGNDMFGDQAIAGFQKDGIITDYVLRDDNAPSGVAEIMVAESGENSIAVAPGANANLSPADIKAARSVIETSDVVVLQLEIPLETVQTAAEIAHAANVPLVLNPAPACELPRELLEHITILTPNETEAALLSGIPLESEDFVRKAGEKLLALGIETVIMTLGENGVSVISSAGQKQYPAFKVKAVDTTAAGDVFTGNLAAAFLQKSLPVAVQYAQAAAACSVTRMGAQPSAPTPDVVHELIKLKKPDES